MLINTTITGKRCGTMCPGDEADSGRINSSFTSGPVPGLACTYSIHPTNGNQCQGFCYVRHYSPKNYTASDERVMTFENDIPLCAFHAEYWRERMEWIMNQAENDRTMRRAVTRVVAAIERDIFQGNPLDRQPPV